MERGLGNNAAPSHRRRLKSGMPAVCLILLSCVIIFISGMAAAGERPARSGLPTVMLYVGSG